MRWQGHAKLYIIFYLYNRQAYIVAVVLNLERLYDAMIRLPTKALINYYYKKVC